MCHIYPTKIKFSQCCHVCNWAAKHNKHYTSFLYKIQILKPTDNTQNLYVLFLTTIWYMELVVYLLFKCLWQQQNRSLTQWNSNIVAWNKLLPAAKNYSMVKRANSKLPWIATWMKSESKEIYIYIYIYIWVEGKSYVTTEKEYFLGKEKVVAEKVLSA